MLRFACCSLLLVPLLAGCASPGVRELASKGVERGELSEIARSEGQQWTGLAVSAGGRVFVNYPRWSGPHTLSVAEIITLSGGVQAIRAYPDNLWNGWIPGGMTSPAEHFVCVQAVYVDAQDDLWILDPASPQFGGVVPGGAKLVHVDLATDRVVRVYRFDDAIAPKDSYLNDIRIDPRDATAFITDSGRGGIVVLNLRSGQARRVLDRHPATQAEEITPVIGGRPWVGPGGAAPKVHSDGLALDFRAPQGGWLWFQALTSRTLHRVPLAALKDPSLSPEALGALVERVGEPGASVMTDGMDCDLDGNLYFTALEQDAIVVRRPSGRYETLVADPRIAWPDSFSLGPGSLAGAVFFTTAQIHRTPPFAPTMPATPYFIFKTAPAGPETAAPETAEPAMDSRRDAR